VSCPTEELAHQIAQSLVEKSLAACVFVGAAGTSYYRWEEKLQKATEWPLWIKTKSSLFVEITQEICQLHPYEVPQILSMSIENALPAYLSWLDKETS
jgi:periplasmic divalent cation tolerance protein